MRWRLSGKGLFPGEFPVYSLLIREFDVETGSLKTGRTTNFSRGLQ